MSEKKVVIFGNNTVGVELTEFCRNHPGIEVLGVRPEPGDKGVDGWQKSLRKYCQDHQLPILEWKNLSDEKVLHQLRGWKPDFIFSFQCRAILKKDLIKVPSEGVVNLHFAKLPKYRGCYPIAWALLNGENSIGVTWHYIDEGIDTGDIIYQRDIPVEPQDSARSLFDKATSTCVEDIGKVLEMVFPGKAVQQKQNATQATYYSKHSIDFNRNFVDWNRPTEEVARFVRAFNFPPMQYPCTRFSKRVISIEEIGNFLKEDYLAQPGSILRVGSKIVVATRDGSIDIKSFIYKGNSLSAEDLAADLGVKPGGLFYF